MQFRVSEDVAAPARRVWSGFSDFSMIEAEVRAGGAELSRVGDWSEARPGAKWQGVVLLRGKPRPIEAKVSEFVPQRRLAVRCRVDGMECSYEVALDPLEAVVTRVLVQLELSASTMSSRLVLQSMKVARGRVLRRVEGAVARQGREVERSWRASS